MSFFNTKYKKTYIGDNRKTLDAKHNEMVKQFKDEKNTLAKKKEILAKYEIEFGELNAKNKNELNDVELDRKYELNDLIKKHKSYIKNIETNENELEYFMEIGQLLNDYYDNIKKIANKNTSNNNNNDVQQNNTEDKSDINNYISSSYNFKKADYLDKYLKITDDTYTPSIKYNTTHNKCDRCNREMIIVQVEAIIVCESCGLSKNIIIDSNKPNYKDPPPEISYFAYKRINHFIYWSVITDIMYNLLVILTLSKKTLFA